MLPVTLLAAGLGCGTSTPSSPSPVPTTVTYKGTASASAAGVCSGDLHTFQAAPGTIAVTLVETSPAENMTVQICSTSSSTDCSLTRRRIDVGQTIAVPRNGLTTQSLSLLPLTCGTNAPPSPAPIAYTATVTYSK